MGRETKKASVSCRAFAQAFHLSAFSFNTTLPLSFYYFLKSAQLSPRHQKTHFEFGCIPARQTLPSIQAHRLTQSKCKTQLVIFGFVFYWLAIGAECAMSGLTEPSEVH